MEIRIDIKSIFGNVLFSFERENNTIKNTLVEATLNGANLREADLCETDLRGADLRGADLEYADLSEADLRRADFKEADLKGADLSDIYYSVYTSFLTSQCPTDGSFIGWKRLDKYIVKLKICEDADRSSSTSIICRCSKAEVLEIQNINGSIADITEICSSHDKTFIYKVGETVEVKDFDKCRWNKFSNGIHFFIDRNMAVAYRK